MRYFVSLLCLIALAGLVTASAQNIGIASSQIGGASAAGGGSGDITRVAQCLTGDCFVNLTIPDNTDTVVERATTDTLTNKTVDAEGTGNAITIPVYVVYEPALCQSSAASVIVGVPVTSAAPTAVCATIGSAGSNQTALLQFVDTTLIEIGGHFRLPADWTGNIDLDLFWRTTATTGNVIWSIRVFCVADGETLISPTIGTQQDITDAAKGTASQINTASQAAVTTTGCAADEELFWLLHRDGTAAGDTIAATADLLSFRFKLRRAM